MKIFIRLCKLVGTGHPYKAACHSSIACDTIVIKSATANKGKKCAMRSGLEMLPHLENQID